MITKIPPMKARAFPESLLVRSRVSPGCIPYCLWDLHQVMSPEPRLPGLLTL